MDRGTRRQLLLVLWVCLLMIPVGSGSPEQREPAEELASNTESIAQCALEGAAVPVYQRTTPDWGFAFHMNSFGNVYVSWYMTSEMSIGVDQWVFGAVIENEGGQASMIAQSPFAKSGACRYIGNIHFGDFHFVVQGGGMGNQGGSSCTTETWWETKVTVEIGVTVKGPEGGVKGEFAFGGHESCTESSLYDSEIVIGESETSMIPTWFKYGPPVRGLAQVHHAR